NPLPSVQRAMTVPPTIGAPIAAVPVIICVGIASLETALLDWLLPILDCSLLTLLWLLLVDATSLPRLLDDTVPRLGLGTFPPEEFPPPQAASRSDIIQSV